MDFFGEGLLFSKYVRTLFLTWLLRSSASPSLFSSSLLDSESRSESSKATGFVCLASVVMVKWSWQLRWYCFGHRQDCRAAADLPHLLILSACVCNLICTLKTSTGVRIRKTNCFFSAWVLECRIGGQLECAASAADISPPILLFQYVCCSQETGTIVMHNDFKFARRNFKSGCYLLQPLRDVGCFIAVLQWHGRRTDWFHVPNASNVVARNAKVGFSGFTCPYISTKGNVAVCGFYGTPHSLECHLVHPLHQFGECDQGWACGSFFWILHPPQLIVA